MLTRTALSSVTESASLRGHRRPAQCLRRSLLGALIFKQKARDDHVSVPDVALERPVPRLRCPSLQHFRKQFLVPRRPVILEGVADQWPCMTKWRWVALPDPAPRPHPGTPRFRLPSSQGNAASRARPDHPCVDRSGLTGDYRHNAPRSWQRWKGPYFHSSLL